MPPDRSELEPLFDVRDLTRDARPGGPPLHLVVPESLTLDQVAGLADDLIGGLQPGCTVWADVPGDRPAARDVIRRTFERAGRGDDLDFGTPDPS